MDEAETPVKKPAYSHNGSGGASRQIRKYPTIGAENEDNSSHSRQESRSSDSNPRSNAPSLNPQVSDVKQFAPNYDDLHGYLEQPQNDWVHWSTFNHNITSSEPEIKPVIDSLKAIECQNQLFDLRPYMIDQPVKLDMYAHLGEALQLFRLHHMRHLLVVSPLDGSLAGIITRKDLNAFMNY